jgi:hypothetical protein
MGLLAAERLKSMVADNVFGTKVLKFGAFGPGTLGESHEFLGSVQISVVVSRDICNKIRGFGWANLPGSNSETAHRLTLVGQVCLVGWAITP